jgi:glycosyltransferase involved in cell wall biosynthesis
MAWAALRLQPGAALVHRNGAPSPLRDTRLYRAIWSDVDRMVVNSQFMRETLLQQTPWISRTPMDVIYNGKDLDYWRPMPDESAAVRTELGIPQDAFVVQFHGVLQPRKNVDLLILASALLPAPVHALIVGDGPEAGRLRDLARTADLPATFTGFRSDLPRVLAAADAMVHMSRAEGFSNSVVEALACGLPVVASDATSHREQVEDDRTGWLVEPDNARAVADKLEILQRDPELRRRMSTAARQQAVDNYDIRRMVDRYVQVLLRAVNSP